MWKELKEATADMRTAESYAPLELSAANAGIKHDDGKLDLTLISPELVEEMAKVRTFGLSKYPRSNWQKGFKYNRSIAAALRHITAFRKGENTDPESGLTHIAHALCCLEHLLHDTMYRPENDDREAK